MSFTPNMGGMDRLLRAAVGAVLVVLLLMGQIAGTWAWVAGIVAVAMLGSAAIRVCPAYTLFGIRTCKTS